MPSGMSWNHSAQILKQYGTTWKWQIFESGIASIFEALCHASFSLNWIYLDGMNEAIIWFLRGKRWYINKENMRTIVWLTSYTLLIWETVWLTSYILHMYHCSDQNFMHIDYGTPVVHILLLLQKKQWYKITLPSYILATLISTRRTLDSELQDKSRNVHAYNWCMLMYVILRRFAW